MIEVRENLALVEKSAAASESGFPLNVPPKTTPEVYICSMMSAFPAMTLSGAPPPTALPNVARSGVTLKWACAPPGLIRKPVITSSKINRQPYFVASSRTL